MQQKWVEKLGRGNRYICWSVVSTRVAMSHELGGEGGSVGIRQFGRVMRTGFRALSQVFSSFGWVGVPRRSTSHETSLFFSLFDLISDISTATTQKGLVFQDQNQGRRVLKRWTATQWKGCIPVHLLFHSWMECDGFHSSAGGDSSG